MSVAWPRRGRAPTRQFADGAGPRPGWADDREQRCRRRDGDGGTVEEPVVLAEGKESDRNLPSSGGGAQTSRSGAPAVAAARAA